MFAHQVRGKLWKAEFITNCLNSYVKCFLSFVIFRHLFKIKSITHLCFEKWVNAKKSMWFTQCLCVVHAEGFEKRTYLHFLVLNNFRPYVTLCLRDIRKEKNQEERLSRGLSTYIHTRHSCWARRHRNPTCRMFS